jgi:hypothetical protein
MRVRYMHYVIYFCLNYRTIWVLIPTLPTNGTGKDRKIQKITKKHTIHLIFPFIPET